MRKFDFNNQSFTGFEDSEDVIRGFDILTEYGSSCRFYKILPDFFGVDKNKSDVLPP